MSWFDDNEDYITSFLLDTDPYYNSSTFFPSNPNLNEDPKWLEFMQGRGVKQLPWSKTVKYVDVDKIVKMKCLQAGVWLSKDGPIQICQMTDSHLQNALNLVKRRQRDEVDTLAVEILQKEIDRRKTEKWIF